MTPELDANPSRTMPFVNELLIGVNAGSAAWRAHIGGFTSGAAILPVVGRRG